ncbi:sec-independent protein translocase protein tatc chloroplastic [Phtheirospermum japonicum]|uniref:Sec-independent protein translocase protein tatc chloroplastic n=1 Tax=Phtheirospermum japonicum TaxID=374723 RepID=A0A830BCJ1_9LAMI|nr:sec-independent protein translocase protein tatc chloroplastic [Phtheirospermum japonicum]
MRRSPHLKIFHIIIKLTTPTIKTFNTFWCELNSAHFFHTQHTPAMGSIGTLFYNPHINRNNLCFKCLNSNTHQSTILRINRTKPNLLSFSNNNGYKKFKKIICSAIEDVTNDKQREINGGSLNGAGPSVEDRLDSSDEVLENPFLNNESDEGGNSIYNFIYPSKELLPDDKEMSIYDHLEELRERIFVSVLAVGAAMVGCFAFSKDLIMFLEAPVKAQGVRFLQLAPGEFFFTTLKVSGYCGLLLGSPVIIYEIIAFILPGLTKSERRFLGPIVLGSSILFYTGIAFSYYVLTPAALNFFVSYAEGVVESLWSIDQYFEFVLVLMLSTGLSFQILLILDIKS